MSGEGASRRVRLGLADEANGAVVSATWIEPLLQLGKVARRQLPSLGRRQLVIAISVPCRDYAAALVACGWALSAPPLPVEVPLEVFRTATSGAPLRVVTDAIVASGPFGWIDENRAEARVFVASQTRAVDRYKVARRLGEPVEAVVTPLPKPGTLGQRAGVAATWLERIAAPAADLALVGTAAWLRHDLETYVGAAGPTDPNAVPLANYVLPEGGKVATWSTRIYSAAKLIDELPLPSRFRGVILDGYGAIKYLNDIEAPVVVCVVDRSVGDESASEVVMQARSANSRRVSLSEECGWRTPPGVEALAFTVAL